MRDRIRSALGANRTRQERMMRAMADVSVQLQLDGELTRKATEIDAATLSRRVSRAVWLSPEPS